MKSFKDFLSEAKQIGWRLAKTEWSCSLVYDTRGPSYSIYQGKTPGIFYGHKSPSGSAVKGEPQELAVKLKLPPIPDDLLKAFLEGVKKLNTEGVDHRALGKRGQYDITDVGRPVKGELLDYYDRKGDKHQGKVKSVNAQDVMTLTDTATGETVKLTLVKP